MAATTTTIDPTTEAAAPRRRYGPWRAASLILVNLLMVAHFVHWKLSGRTVAPLEFSELIHAVSEGVITAGAIFMGIAVLATLVFGRFFCSWACHVLALQDGSRWILNKLGIKPKPVRSRALLFVPPLTALYLFAWPVILRFMQGEPQPMLHFAGDVEGWGSFVTENYWRSMPGPWVAALTFSVCGFITVYVLGSRSFCTYVCPYGAVFKFADRFAPGSIKVAEGCDECSQCTAACGNYVRVAEEVKQHGHVVNPACMKAMDCVSACPKDVLSFGFAKPALFASRKSGGRFGLPYSFTVTEDVAVGVVCLAVVLIFNGLYGHTPFLLALSLGGLIGYLVVLATRLVRPGEVKLGGLRLKSATELRPAGIVFGTFAIALAAFVVHSGFIRYHEVNGVGPAFAIKYEPDRAARRQQAEAALVHLAAVDRWGLFPNEPNERGLLKALLHLGRFDEAEPYAARLVERHEDDALVRLYLAQCLDKQGKLDAAEREYRAALERIGVADETQRAFVEEALAEIDRRR
jgi:polyferredoxin